MTQVEKRTVRPARRLRGAVRVPGDKSVSHRVAMLSALAPGASEITGFLASEDCLHTLKAMAALGAKVSWEGDIVRVEGRGMALDAPSGTLDLGNSGTGMRLLSGLLAGQPFTSEMTGDASLCSRPMGRIRAPIELMGARVDLLGENGCAPVRIHGGCLRGIEYRMPVASAQVKSCALLAGLFADGPTTVVEPAPTRDHTERLLSALGVPVQVDGGRITIPGWLRDGHVFPAGAWQVPGDFSSAAFWMAAAAGREGSEVVIDGVGLNPRRTAFMDVLLRMGAAIEVTGAAPAAGGAGSGAWEPAGRLTITGRALRAAEVGGDEIPNLIDELPLVAVAGAMAEGETVVRDAAELRVKESDRIAATAEGLRAFGVPVEERPDGFRVTGGRPIRGGVEIDSHGDHRIAMAMAVLALFADAPVCISDVACVSTSYPEFWAHLEELEERE